ncbi:hypothetical protein [Bacillus sp. OG2]|uniref:hypothetical protein n=1 Tax=Bacillus infantis TaxID=324767 RepID=UPI000B9BDE35|nr:hypothetical protein B9K06_04625 [Bacillus sp. OG2]
MLKFILAMLILLVIVVTIRKKIPSASMQFLTHVLLYLIEILTVTTIFNYFIGRYEGTVNNATLLNTLKNYVFGYTVYQLFLLVTFKLKDSLDIDSFNSIKGEIDRMQLFAEFKRELPYNYIEGLSEKVNSTALVYNEEQRSHFNKIIDMARLYDKGDATAEEFRFYLKYQSLQLDLSTKIISYGWMNSVLLRWFK